MAGNTTDQPASPPRRLGWLRNARIGSKLGLILLVPLIATVALAAVRLSDSLGRASEAEMVRSLAAVSVRAAAVAHQLHQERILTAGLLADQPDPEATALRTAWSRTDQAVGAYQAARSQLGQVPEAVTARLATLDSHIAGLEPLRRQVRDQAADEAVSAAILRYGAILSDLLAYQQAVAGAVDDPTLSEQARAVAAWANAKAHAGNAEAIAALAVAEVATPELVDAFAATQTGQQEAFLTFGQIASPRQQAVADQAITGGTPGTGSLEDPDADPAGVASSLAATVEAARWVERQLLDQLLTAATQTRQAVFGQVVVESVAVVLALAAAVAIAALLARMLARSLRALRNTATTVAQRDLPAAVARLSDPRTLGSNTPAQLAAQVAAPITLGGRDEIGEVARAFNQVHREAVRTAAEQAALRTSVATMFLNLARRSQTLVDKMVNHIDVGERREEDPDRLAWMFTMDHLATRMRRNDENLLILAGADSSPPRSRDALVADVLRAAQSEVEHYTRIEFGTVDADVSVHAAAVNDVARLVAELLDNATRFSPPHQAVVCEARRLADQMIVQVEDRGVGIAATEVERLNGWLARPGELEVTAFRRMGVAVIARLAARHQIHVRLQSHPHHGTTATVTLPPSILVLPATRLRAFQAAPPATPRPVEPAPAAPPVPARYLGQPPPGAAAVVHQPVNRPTSGTAGADHDRMPQQDLRVELPVAGRPAPPSPAPPSPGLPSRASGPAAGGTVRETTIELPIYQQMAAVWFRDHPADPAAATPLREPAGNTGPVVRAEPAAPPAAAAGGGQGERWYTAADNGWAAAAAAAEPSPGGSTVSGLPRRVPQAQLVPGSVEGQPVGAVPAQRRSPEQVRGLLSAYQRGVQRGREGTTR